MANKMKILYCAPNLHLVSGCSCGFGNLFAEKKGGMINLFALPIFIFFRKNIQVCRER